MRYLDLLVLVTASFAASMGCCDSRKSETQPTPADPAGRKVNVEAGPLWDNAHAQRVCPGVCKAPWSFTGQWSTTVPGQMSVCECATASRDAPPPAPLTAAAPPSAATPAPAAGPTIECGQNKCQAGSELCCTYNGKKPVCKPAPAKPIGDALLNACGSRAELAMAMACDDSGDCEGDKQCFMPVRWGTAVSYATQECLAPNDPYAESVERCGKGGTCKRKGMKCGSQGICVKG